MAQTGGFSAAPSPTGSMGGGAIGSGGGMMLTPAMSRPQPPQNQQMIPGQQNNQGTLSPMGMYAKSAQMNAGNPQGGMSMDTRVGTGSGGFDMAGAKQAWEQKIGAAPAQGGMEWGSPPGGSGFGQSGLSKNPQVGSVGMGTNPQGGGIGQPITQMGTRVGTGGASGPVSWGNAQPMQSMPGQMAQKSMAYNQAQKMGAMPGQAPPPQQAPAYGAQNSARQGFAPSGRNQMVSALRRPV